MHVDIKDRNLGARRTVVDDGSGSSRDAVQVAEAERGGAWASSLLVELERLLCCAAKPLGVPDAVV